MDFELGYPVGAAGFEPAAMSTPYCQEEGKGSIDSLTGLFSKSSWFLGPAKSFCPENHIRQPHILAFG